MKKWESEKENSVVGIMALLSRNATKYAGNPIIISGEELMPGGFCVRKAYALRNILGIGDSFIGLLYSRDGTGWALSRNGRVWTRYAGNPVLDIGATGEWDSLYAAMTEIVKKGDTYYGFYIGAPKDAKHFHYGLATSTDLATWTKYAGNPIVPHGGKGEWDENHVVNASVLYDEEEKMWKMWYEGIDAVNQEVCGYASAPDPEGPWTKHPDNPIFKFGELPNGGGACCFDVVKVNGVYLMFFCSIVIAGDHAIHAAVSRNGIDWSPFPEVIVPRGGAGEWDEKWQAHPCVVKDIETEHRLIGNRLQLFYLGKSDGMHGLGYAYI